MEVDLLVTALADEEDSYFQGDLMISGTVFSYDLRFIVPIDQYNRKLRGKTLEEFRKAIDIRIRTAETELELENDEWNFFYQILMRLAVHIHEKRLLVERSGRSAGPAVSAIGGPVGLKPRACHILARPKFGCQLLNPTSDPRQKPS